METLPDGTIILARSKWGDPVAQLIRTSSGRYALVLAVDGPDDTHAFLLDPAEEVRIGDLHAYLTPDDLTGEA